MKHYLQFQVAVYAGFLSTGDSNAPGNYALLDLVAALHWVKENIQSFGGDANEVTLMGHGYGASMVNLLLISPVTKGQACCCITACRKRDILKLGYWRIRRYVRNDQK